ncbi:MAG: glutathione S-transferase family protein [Polyangiales bacterium]
MGKLVEGRWVAGEVAPGDARGAFVRADSTFRSWVREDGTGPHVAEAGRYHLYVAHACPWAHRTLIARALLGLEEVVSVSIVHPLMGDQGWVFRDEPGLVTDPIHGADALWQVYVAADSTISGKATVPVLWDKQAATIVNNESRDILRMLCTAFLPLAVTPRPLSPEALRPRIDETLDAIYEPINNGVYRAGFARTQEAYDDAVHALFAALDHWEEVLGHQRYTCGATLSEADICLFTTLLRFDLVYATHFKCNLRRLVDYPSLFGFVRDVYQTPGVATTCDVARIKQHYFRSHPFINPHGIVPIGFDIDFGAPHERASLSGRAST